MPILTVGKQTNLALNISETIINLHRPYYAKALYDELEEAGESTTTAATETQKPARRAFWGAPRAPMTLALSEDDGLTWPWQRNLEVGDGWCMSNDSAGRRNREYSYPSIRQTADGALHAAYTVFRQHIRHARVTPDWITQAIAE